MQSIIGIAVVVSMVFGGYLAAGGKMGIIVASLPFEMMMIGGAAVGAFIISNDARDIKGSLKSLSFVFKGAKYKSDDYCDLLCLLKELIALSTENPVALEEQIEDYENSEIFKKYPNLLQDHTVIDIITDTLRGTLFNFNDPHQVEELLEKRLSEHLHHRSHPSHALQAVADALPALGIVAAVLGVIKTMGAIDSPPEYLGKLIGGALVGTFLGVFLAYGLVGPMAIRLKAIAEQDQKLFDVLRDVFIAHLQKHPLPLIVEIGRQNIPEHLRPDFKEFEEKLAAKGS